jgi:hypothetical protein
VECNERQPVSSVAVDVGGKDVFVDVGGCVDVDVSEGGGVRVSVGVSVSRMKGVNVCVAEGWGVKLGVWLGGTKPVLVIVGVSVMVGDSSDVEGVCALGVSECWRTVGVCVGVIPPGACRIAVHPAQ